MLQLGADDLIAEGVRRDVFRHPGNPNLLVKVLKRSFIEKRSGQGKAWYNFKHLRHRYFRQWRSAHLSMYLSEIREQLALAEAGLRHPRYLQWIEGFEETSRGLGLTVQAIRGRDGNLAPTVGSIAQAGELSAARRSELDEFLDELLRSPITISDLNLDNIVLGYSQDIGEHFVLIDGYGTRTLIPVERLSEAAKRSSKLRQFSRLRGLLDKVPVSAPARADNSGSLKGYKGMGARQGSRQG
jgi:hypothetical protein